MIEYTKEEYEVYRKVHAKHVQEDMISYYDNILNDEPDEQTKEHANKMIDIISRMSVNEIMGYYSDDLFNAYWDAEHFDYCMENYIDNFFKDESK